MLLGSYTCVYKLFSELMLALYICNTSPFTPTHHELLNINIKTDLLSLQEVANGDSKHITTPVSSPYRKKKNVSITRNLIICFWFVHDIREDV